MPISIRIRCIAFLLALGSVAGAQVNILAASEFQPALEELRKSYTAVTGVPTHATYGSSGALAAKAKAPGTDVYIASDKSWADIVAATPRADGPVLVFASIPICIWTRGTGVEPDPMLAQLQRENVGRVAIADSANSPDGALAAKAMHNLASWPDIQRRILLLPDAGAVAESLSAPATLPEPDSATAPDKATTKSPKRKPVIPLTDAFFPQPLLWGTPIAGIGRWVAVDTSLAPYLHPSLVRLRSLNPTRGDASQKFIDFLQSPRGRSILRAKGFLPPP